MKSIKKLFITAGILLQLSAGLYADNWSDAIEAFGGKDNVSRNDGTMPWTRAQSLARDLGNTPEALAVGMHMAKGKSRDLENKFIGSAPKADLLAALAGAPVVAPVIEQQRVVAPGTQEEAPASAWNWGMGNAAQQQAPVQETAAESSSLWNWIAGAPTEPVVTQADIIKAQEQQKQADAAQVTQNDLALSAVVNSGKEGVALYNPMIDIIITDVQAAINGIEDPAVQQQTLQHFQQKAANMQATAGANQKESRLLGRMNSKKKKSNNKKKHK